MNKIGKLAALTLAASATFLMASPSSAEENGSATNAAAAAAAQASKKPAAETRKYCVMLEAVTGSRVSRKSCRTKAEWAAEGVDVDSK